jgi:hypothetical protein
LMGMRNSHTCAFCKKGQGHSVTKSSCASADHC